MKIGTKINFKEKDGSYIITGRDETQHNIKFAINENGHKISFIWEFINQETKEIYTNPNVKILSI